MVDHIGQIAHAQEMTTSCLACKGTEGAQKSNYASEAIHISLSLTCRLAIKSASLEGELAHTKWMNEADKNSRVIIGRHELTNAVAFAVGLLSTTVHAIIQRTTLRELAQSSRIRLNDLHHICVVLGQAKRSWRLVFHQWSCWIEA